jgi:hypothetical protein
MSPLVEAGTPTLREAVAAEALSPENDVGLLGAVETLRRACGDTLEGLVFFGSRRTRAANANAWSAYDLLAVVPSYKPFYEALHRAGLMAKRPALMALLSRWLPPTQISLRFTAPELHAKVSVLRFDTFLRETSRARRDHFTIGRLFQPSRILLARSEAARAAMLDALVSAHAETWRWARPWLPERFDAEAYGCRALEISMSWEIRPEPPGRAAALWDVQRAAQQPVFEALLAELERQRAVRRLPGEDASWAAVLPVTVLERLELRFYFSRSIARATTRWAKHMLSFEGWLDYIARKASRHTGEPIELTSRERRWPLVFLWGRVFRYLREKKRKGTPR